jgi:DNA-binding PadR family transcriptional regulator
MPDDLLGGLQQLVMLAVLRLGTDAYGARIQQELEARAGRTVAISTVYVTLGRLERRGLVRSRLGSPTPIRGGKAKRCYALTAAGTLALRQSRSTLSRMWAGLREARG